MRALEGMPGIKVGGYNMNNIRYADDTVLIADNENELQEMLVTVVRESEKKGISLNKKKTEVMVISKKNCTPACNIVMNGTVLKQVHKFNYLGSLITSDGRCISAIKWRMAQAKASFQNMKSILTNKRLSLGVRKRVLQCYIEPILLSVLPRLLLQGAAPCPLFVTRCPFEKAEMTPCPFDYKKKKKKN